MAETVVPYPTLGTQKQELHYIKELWCVTGGSIAEEEQL